MHGGTVLLSISGVGMEIEGYVQQAEIIANYQHWDNVLHDMYLLSPEESLSQSIPSRPTVLILGSVQQAQALLQCCLDSVVLPEGAAKILYIYPENEDALSDQTGNYAFTKIAYPMSAGQLVDFYVIPDLSGLPQSSLQDFKQVYQQSHLLINLDTHPMHIDKSLDSSVKDMGPLLYLESQQLNVSRSSEKSRNDFWQQRVVFHATAEAASYVHKLPQLWPCILAQLLERQLQSLMHDSIPRLMRWRRRWMVSVALLDMVMFAGVLWGMVQWGWWQGFLHLSWSTLPTLLATATFFVVVLIFLISGLFLWRVHKGTCILCSVAAVSCLRTPTVTPKNALRRAFLKNTQSFWQTLSCRDLCGWSHTQQDEALTFCQYCQTLKLQLLAHEHIAG